MFVKDIGDLVGFDHIIGVAICSETDENTAFYKLQHWWTADSVSHIGLWVMYDHGVGIFENCHFFAIDMNAMNSNGVFA